MEGKPSSQDDTMSTRHKTVSEAYIRRTKSERATTRIRIQVQDQFREERGEIPGDLWSMIQTMTNSFPQKPSSPIEDKNYSLSLEETLSKVNDCFKVFKCRYSKYTMRGALPVIYRIFIELIELLEDCLVKLRRVQNDLVYKKHSDTVHNNIKNGIFEKVDVYNNMVLLMTQASSHNIISYAWLQRINIALHSDDRRVTT